MLSRFKEGRAFLADKLEMLESMYASLKLEARIDYHLNILENSYRLLRTKIAGDRGVTSIWYNTYEIVDESISKLRIIKGLLSKYRYTGLHMYLADALQLANELIIKIDSKAALPAQKDTIRMILSEIIYELRGIIKSTAKEPDITSSYTKAF